MGQLHMTSQVIVSFFSRPAVASHTRRRAFPVAPRVTLRQNITKNMRAHERFACYRDTKRCCGRVGQIWRFVKRYNFFSFKGGQTQSPRSLMRPRALCTDANRFQAMVSATGFEPVTQ